MAENNRKPTVIMVLFLLILYLSISLYLYIKSDFKVSRSLTNLKNIRVITPKKAELLMKVSMYTFQVLKLSQAD